MTLDEIRKELKEVRYYYANRERLCKLFKEFEYNSVYEKAKKYEYAIKTAPIMLYDLFFETILFGKTQDAVSKEWHYTIEHVNRLNKKMLIHLQNNITD